MELELKQKLVTLGIVIVLIAGACNLSAGSVTNGSSAEATLAALAVQSTLDAAARLTQDAGGGSSGGDSSGGDNSAPTDTPLPQETPQPTLTPTSNTPTISVSVDTNCRQGPGNVYFQTGALLVGEITEVLGRLSNNQFVLVRNPDGGADCWLWMQYATISGDLNALPVMTPPPTPTPTFTPTPILWFHGPWTTRIDGDNAAGSVAQTGTSISGSFDLGGSPFTIVGTVDGPELKHATGTWSYMGFTGTFEWQIRPNTNQFHGNGFTNGVGGPWEFCGWRSGASQPSPCQWP